jgi:hypothetical protein
MRKGADHVLAKLSPGCLGVKSTLDTFFEDREPRLNLGECYQHRHRTFLARRRLDLIYHLPDLEAPTIISRRSKEVVGIRCVLASSNGEKDIRRLLISVRPKKLALVIGDSNWVVMKYGTIHIAFICTCVPVWPEISWRS